MCRVHYTTVHDSYAAIISTLCDKGFANISVCAAMWYSWSTVAIAGNMEYSSPEKHQSQVAITKNLFLI